VLRNVNKCLNVSQVTARAVLHANRCAGGPTQLSRALAEPPFCIRNPSPSNGVCQAYLTTLGGGLLPIDKLNIDIVAHERAQFFLGSQSATRVFKSPLSPSSSSKNGVCEQSVQGEVMPGALVVYLPDPIMLFAHSRFQQKQDWILHPGARLALGEVLQAGRIAQGEVYAFDHYRSSWRVSDAHGRPLLLDRISLDPNKHSMEAPGCMAIPEIDRPTPPSGSPVYTQWASFAFCGPGWNALEKTMQAALRDLPLWPWGISGPDEAPRKIDRGLMAAVWRKDENVLLLRALAVNRESLNPVLKPLHAALARQDALGFSPWERKF
jgi:urease accessory protein